jgi:MarR family transcriptional regulator, transcriptional regulator for hemolysin
MSSLRTRSALSVPESGARLGDFLRTGYLIHDVSRLRRQFYDQQSRHLGITRSQWWVLFNLARHEGEPLNQNELASLLELGSASVGELVLRLEKAGFVKRIPDPFDRRAKRIVVAERGQDVLDHMRIVARDNNAMIMDGVSPAEQDLLNTLLARMKGNLARLLESAPAAGETSDGESVAAEAGAA